MRNKGRRWFDECLGEGQVYFFSVMALLTCKTRLREPKTERVMSDILGLKKKQKALQTARKIKE